MKSPAEIARDKRMKAIFSIEGRWYNERIRRAWQNLLQPIPTKDVPK
jgi:hypothetical protein